MSIYEDCTAAGVQIDNHASDMYIPVNAVTQAIVARYRKETGLRIDTFTNQVDGKLWYDVPFAFVPWWEKRNCTA